MLSLFKTNCSVSVCMPNNLGYWQDQISLSDPTIPGTPEMDCLKLFVVNTSDCLRQYFVICKEQGGQAQTSQVSWHLLTCMCTFWQRNWINDCSSFHVDPMWFWGQLQTMTTIETIQLLKHYHKRSQATYLRHPWDGWVW